MPITEVDDRWFRANPGREYRLRRQTPAELRGWLVPPREGFTGWCIIRGKDGATSVFASAITEPPEDHDFDLGRLFADVGEAA